MSRISTAQVFDSGQSHLSEAKDREVESSEKASSFKKIVRPSQDPTGWVNAANLKDTLSVRDTIAKNASIATHALTVMEGILSQAQDYCQRAHQLAVTASSSGIVTEGNRTAILNEVKGLWDNLIRSLNTSYGGRTLLAGFQTRKPAYSSQGKFLADEGSFQIEVGPGLLMPVNLSPEQIIEGKGLVTGVNILDTFQRLMSGLANSDTNAIRGTLEDFISAVDQLSNGRSIIGARQTEIDRALASHSEEKIEQLDNIAQIEEADPAKVFSDLARDQTALHATMSTTHKILTEDPLSIFFK